MISNYTIGVIHHWPQSQVCSSCKHGEFIQSKTFESSDYFCKLGIENNKGNCKISEAESTQDVKELIKNNTCKSIYHESVIDSVLKE